MIEDVAEASDDEEAYGQFQHEQEYEVEEHTWRRTWNWFDEYQTVRKSDLELK